MVFFLIIFTWTVCWLFWNMFAPKSLRFDPYPGFVLWLFISLTLSTFPDAVVADRAKNPPGRGADERAKRDLSVNVKAEKEIKEIKAQLADILSRLEEIKAAKGDANG